MKDYGILQKRRGAISDYPVSNDVLDIERLRVNSRRKHQILKDYLPAWFSILGAHHKTLNYFDCFAGGGKYVWKDKTVEGSPVISIKACIDLLNSSRPSKPEEINLFFIDDDKQQLQKLQKEIDSIPNIPAALNIELREAKSEDLMKRILAEDNNMRPSFFFIDPYGHPFSLNFMKEILERPKTEIMVNIMYFRIVMDLNNPGKANLCDRLLYPENPKDVAGEFIDNGRFSPAKINDYFHRRLGAQYYIPFHVHYGPDENVSSDRLKYLLVHYSNNFTAFKLMLDIMWKNSDDGNPLTVIEGQPPLFPLKDVSDLESHIGKKYLHTGQEISFANFLSANWRLYFKEKHYRDVLKKLAKKGMIGIQRIESRATGLKGRDLLIFS